MLKLERYDKIIQIVNERGSASVDDLCDALKVSMATIRRDLVDLDNAKMILRTRGGAMKNANIVAEEVPLYQRFNIEKKAKEAVASQALQLIEEGSMIYIGAGTTAYALASHLGNFRRLIVVTNDINVAQAVSHTENSLIVAGGQLKKESATLHGFYTDSMLQDISVDQAFLTVDAVDMRKGFMDLNMDEVSGKRLVIKNAAKCCMMCDTSKFKVNALVNVCPFSDVDAVITNDDISPATAEQLRSTGMEVHLAKSTKVYS